MRITPREPISFVVSLFQVEMRNASLRPGHYGANLIVIGSAARIGYERERGLGFVSDSTLSQIWTTFTIKPTSDVHFPRQIDALTLHYTFDHFWYSRFVDVVRGSCDPVPFVSNMRCS